MTETRPRAYSQYSREAVALLGCLIRMHRKERKLTAKDLADRAGITRTTLRKIETGDMKCEIGLVFEVAALVGVTLFEPDKERFATLRARVEDRIALLPKTVRRQTGAVDDDF